MSSINCSAVITNFLNPTTFNSDDPVKVESAKAIREQVLDEINQMVGFVKRLEF